MFTFECMRSKSCVCLSLFRIFFATLESYSLLSKMMMNLAIKTKIIQKQYVELGLRKVRINKDKQNTKHLIFNECSFVLHV